MIFVTVGTHEQGFERLVIKMDELVANHVIREDVIIQAGYTKYAPKHCQYDVMIDHQMMEDYAGQARIVITHAGPGSIMLPFSHNKIPIVVPRQYEFREHVDDHQVLFTRKLESQGKVLAVYDINDLEDTILNYYKLTAYMICNYRSNAEEFTERVERICEDLVNGKSKRKNRKGKRIKENKHVNGKEMIK